MTPGPVGSASPTLGRGGARQTQSPGVRGTSAWFIVTRPDKKTYFPLGSAGSVSISKELRNIYSGIVRQQK